MDEITFQVVKILILAFGAFILAMVLTPWWTHFLFKYKLGKQIRSEGTPVFAALHQTKAGTPTMGGVLIWLTLFILILVLAVGALS